MSNIEHLLTEAAAGRIGVDRRFLKSILDEGESAIPEILRFARTERGSDRIDLDPLLVDLFRYWQPQVQAEDHRQAMLDFYMDAIRRAPEDVADDLVVALVPFGPKAVEPLLNLYEELGEEQGSDVAFLLAALGVRDPRILELLVERLEYDASDGAFCLGLYGDPAARPALEKMLAQVPESDGDLRHEIAVAIEGTDSPGPQYQLETFDIFAEYPERALPAFDLLDEGERIAMFPSAEAEIRAGAAHSFFNQELSRAARNALRELAEADPEPAVRGEAWAALGDAASEENAEGKAIAKALIAVLFDESKSVEERGGAAVGLYAIADRDEVRKGLEALYAMGGKARIKALEAMWRSLWQPYAKFFEPHLDPSKPENKDPELLRQALRGAGYFRLSGHIDEIASFFDREEPYDDLREDALFAYALAVPGETSRSRARVLLRKIDKLAGLSLDEAELVKFALDERLRLHGLAPVFETEQHEHDHEHDSGHEHGHTARGHTHTAERNASMPAQKAGRNDPCPCGSGKKYKKCHGA